MNTTTGRVINKITYLIRLLTSFQFPSLTLNQQWHVACEQIEKLKPKINIQCINWVKPSPETVKLNTDGCNKGNPESAGGGEILKDNRGQLIMAFATLFGVCSNNVAEARTLLIGLQWCINNGHLNVVVESDSMVIIRMINRNFKPSWQVKFIIRKIRDLKT